MPESIEAQLNEAMKTSMKAKDKATLSTIRMVKAAMQDTLNQPNGPTETTDLLWQQVIRGYVKKLDKSGDEYRKLGSAGDSKLKEIEQEKEILKPFLPAQIEGPELQNIVSQAIKESGATTPKDGGRVMGLIMKEYRGRVDSNRVKDLVTQALQP